MSLGFLRPFGRDQKIGMAVVGGDDLLVSRIEAIVASSGELPWKPDLDGRVDRLRHQGNTPMREQFARIYVTEAVDKFEPGVRVLDVKAVDTADASTIGLVVTAERADRVIVTSVSI